MGLRQESLAAAIDVGSATIYRWERDGGPEPSGIYRQIYNMLDNLVVSGRDISVLEERFRFRGSIDFVRWIYDSHKDLEGG